MSSEGDAAASSHFGEASAAGQYPDTQKPEGHIMQLDPAQEVDAEEAWAQSVAAALAAARARLQEHMVWSVEELQRMDGEDPIGGTIYRLPAPVRQGTGSLAGITGCCGACWVLWGCSDSCGLGCCRNTARRIAKCTTSAGFACLTTARGRIALFALQCLQAAMATGGGLAFARAWPAVGWLLGIAGLDLPYIIPAVPATTWAVILCVAGVLVSLTSCLSERFLSRPTTADDQRTLAEEGETLAEQHADKWMSRGGGSDVPANVTRAKTLMRVFGPRGAGWAELLQRSVQVSLVLFIPVLRSAAIVLACVPSVAWAVASSATVNAIQAETEGLTVVRTQDELISVRDSILASDAGGTSDPGALAAASAAAEATIALVPLTPYPPGDTDLVALFTCTEQLPTLGRLAALPFSRRWSCACSDAAAASIPTAIAYLALLLFLLPLPLHMWMLLKWSLPESSLPSPEEAEAAEAARRLRRTELSRAKLRALHNAQSNRIRRVEQRDEQPAEVPVTVLQPHQGSGSAGRADRGRRGSVTTALVNSTVALDAEAMAAGRAVIRAAGQGAASPDDIAGASLGDVGELSEGLADGGGVGRVPLNRKRRGSVLDTIGVAGEPTESALDGAHESQAVPVRAIRGRRGSAVDQLAGAVGNRLQLSSVDTRHTVRPDALIAAVAASSSSSLSSSSAAAEEQIEAGAASDRQIDGGDDGSSVARPAAHAILTMALYQCNGVGSRERILTRLVRSRSSPAGLGRCEWWSLHRERAMRDAESLDVRMARGNRAIHHPANDLSSPLPVSQTETQRAIHELTDSHTRRPGAVVDRTADTLDSGWAPCRLVAIDPALPAEPALPTALSITASFQREVIAALRRLAVTRIADANSSDDDDDDNAGRVRSPLEGITSVAIAQAALSPAIDGTPAKLDGTTDLFDVLEPSLEAKPKRKRNAARTDAFAMSSSAMARPGTATGSTSVGRSGGPKAGYMLGAVLDAMHGGRRAVSALPGQRDTVSLRTGRTVSSQAGSVFDGGGSSSAISGIRSIGGGVRVTKSRNERRSSVGTFNAHPRMQSAERVVASASSKIALGTSDSAPGSRTDAGKSQPKSSSITTIRQPVAQPKRSFAASPPSISRGSAGRAAPTPTRVSGAGLGDDGRLWSPYGTRPKSVGGFAQTTAKEAKPDPDIKDMTWLETQEADGKDMAASDPWWSNGQALHDVEEAADEGTDDDTTEGHCHNNDRDEAVDDVDGTVATLNRLPPLPKDDIDGMSDEEIAHRVQCLCCVESALCWNRLCRRHCLCMRRLCCCLPRCCRPVSRLTGCLTGCCVCCAGHSAACSADRAPTCCWIDIVTSTADLAVTELEMVEWSLRAQQRRFQRSLAKDRIAAASPLNPTLPLFTWRRRFALPLSLSVAGVTVLLHTLLWREPLLQQVLGAILALSAAAWHWTVAGTNSVLLKLFLPVRSVALCGCCCGPRRGGQGTTSRPHNSACCTSSKRSHSSTIASETGDDSSASKEGTTALILASSCWLCLQETTGCAQDCYFAGRATCSDCGSCLLRMCCCGCCRCCPTSKARSETYVSGSSRVVVAPSDSNKKRSVRFNPEPIMLAAASAGDVDVITNSSPQDEPLGGTAVVVSTSRDEKRQRWREAIALEALDEKEARHASSLAAPNLPSAAERAAQCCGGCHWPVLSDPGDSLMLQLWLVLIAAVSILGALTAPSGTSTAEDDSNAIAGIHFADLMAVVVTALVWLGAGGSLLAAVMQANPRLARDAATSWGVLKWSQSEYGASAAELGDVDAQAEMEEDVAPLARTLVRAAAAAAAQRVVDSFGDGYREDEDEEHGNTSEMSRRQKSEVAVPSEAVVVVTAQLKAQAQLLAQGLALPDPSYGSAMLLKSDGLTSKAVGITRRSDSDAADMRIPQVQLSDALRAGARGGWNLGAEVIGRVWLGVWDGMLGRGCGQETATRWATLKSEASAFPVSRTLQHARAPSQVTAMRVWVEEQLEGPDVFWDGAMDDGTEPSETRFGTLTVMEFPWRCVLAFDDCDAVLTLWDEDLPSLVARNADPAIGARRLLRRQLRALHDHEVYVPTDRMEEHEIADGIHTFTDAETGKANSTERRVKVEVRVRYRRGILKVKRRDNGDLFSRGFSVSVVFRDGKGVVQAPKTQSIVELRELYLVLGSEEVGITPDFDVTEPLRRMLRHEKVAAALTKRLPVVEAEYADERRRRSDARVHSRWLLDPVLMAEVYAGVGTEVESLEAVTGWFQRWRERHGVTPHDDHPREAASAGTSSAPLEASPAMCLPQTHAAGLSFAFARTQGLAHAGPLATLWFLTFSDAWRCNKHIPAVKKAQGILDDLLPDSLCYRPMPRSELESILLEQRLLGRSRLITPEAIDALYTAVADGHAAELLVGSS